MAAYHVFTVPFTTSKPKCWPPFRDNWGPCEPLNPAASLEKAKALPVDILPQTIKLFDHSVVEFSLSKMILGVIRISGLFVASYFVWDGTSFNIRVHLRQMICRGFEPCSRPRENETAGWKNCFLYSVHTVWLKPQLLKHNLSVVFFELGWGRPRSVLPAAW